MHATTVFPIHPLIESLIKKICNANDRRHRFFLIYSYTRFSLLNNTKILCALGTNLLAALLLTESDDGLAVDLHLESGLDLELASLGNGQVLEHNLGQEGGLVVGGLDRDVVLLIVLILIIRADINLLDLLLLLGEGILLTLVQGKVDLLLTLLGLAKLKDALDGESGMVRNDGDKLSLGPDNTNGLDGVGGDGDDLLGRSNNVLLLESSDQRGLGSASDSNSLIRLLVQAHGGLGEDVAKLGLELGHAGRTSNEKNLVNSTGSQVGLLQDVLDQLVALGKELVGHQLEAETVDGGVEVHALSNGLDGARSTGSAGQVLLGDLGSGLDLQKSLLVAGNVDLGLLLELGSNELDELIIERGTTKGFVVGSLQDGVDAAADREDGDIEGRGAHVEDQSGLVLSIALGGVLSKVVGEGSSDGLLNDLKNVDAGGGGRAGQDLTLVLGEVGGDSENSASDLGSEISLGLLQNVLQLLGNNFRDGEDVLLILEVDLVSGETILGDHVGVGDIRGDLDLLEPIV